MSGCSKAKIGVLDSGIGGLSVLREIHRRLPDQPTVYVGDQLHLPYGPRPLAEIHSYVDGITRFLRAQGVAVVVLACHAASAASLYRLRDAYPDMPFVGIEPAVKPAVEATHSGIVGVLTTQATADGALYRRVVARFAGSARILTQVAPSLVTLAERPNTPDDVARDIVRDSVQPLLDAGADQIVLACTHFPFIAHWIEQIAGPTVTLVDPGPAVARQVERVLPAAVTFETSPVAHRYYTSGDPQAMRDALRRLLATDAPVRRLRWSGDADSAASTVLTAEEV